MIVAGVDGCRGGWLAFKVDLPARATSVKWSISRRGCETAHVILPVSASTSQSGCLMVQELVTKESESLWDNEVAQAFLPLPVGQPCMRRLTKASAVNRRKTGRGLCQQAWGIAPKIKQVDDASHRQPAETTTPFLSKTLQSLPQRLRDVTLK
jgi:hypothetical protein